MRLHPGLPIGRLSKPTVLPELLDTVSQAVSRSGEAAPSDPLLTMREARAQWLRAMDEGVSDEEAFGRYRDASEKFWDVLRSGAGDRSKSE
jgi:hypothetical protein